MVQFYNDCKCPGLVIYNVYSSHCQDLEIVVTACKFFHLPFYLSMPVQIQFVNANAMIRLISIYQILSLISQCVQPGLVMLKS